METFLAPDAPALRRQGRGSAHRRDPHRRRHAGQGRGPGNARRVLLNIHGGGFLSEPTAALAESIPIAATMGVQVISIDYRMSPEAKFPAASEDIAAVYAEVLKTHEPAQVGSMAVRPAAC